MSETSAVAAPQSFVASRRLLAAAILLMITWLISPIRGNLFPLYQVQSQDLPVLYALSISLILISVWNPAWTLPRRLPAAGVMILFGAAAVGLLAWGSYALMGNFPLSRDEHMVVFDMAVFDHGHLATPLSARWRPYALALVPAFLLNEHMPTGLVSAYLPMNALLRLGFSKLADPVWFNPVLALVGGAALLDVARRTFGRDDPACWVALLIYGLSAQMLVNAMTTYSMTGHMALNIIWLAAFLRGGRAGNSIAIAVGFLATGLHQLAFHPFFVAPFLLWRLRQGEWKLVMLYAASYAAIILWWACYPLLAAHDVTVSVKAAPNSNFLTRISMALSDREGNRFALMFLNLIRFVAWQNFALLPLLAPATVVAIRDGGLARVLLLGIVAWLAFITVVLPFQGHGWGYRYLHPYLGSFALLAGYGYRELSNRMGRRADGMVLALSGATALAAIPLLFAAAYQFVEPHVVLERVIASQNTPFVLIDTQAPTATDGRWAANPVDLVRNQPDLTNRPLRFSSRDLNSLLLIRLCRTAPVTLITRRDQHRVGFALNAPERSPKFDALITATEKQVPGCFRSTI